MCAARMCKIQTLHAHIHSITNTMCTSLPFAFPLTEPPISLLGVHVCEHLHERLPRLKQARMCKSQMLHAHIHSRTNTMCKSLPFAFPLTAPPISLLDAHVCEHLHERLPRGAQLQAAALLWCAQLLALPPPCGRNETRKEAHSDNALLKHIP